MKSIEGKMNTIVQSIAEEEDEGQPPMEIPTYEQSGANEEKDDEYERWLSGNR